MEIDHILQMRFKLLSCFKFEVAREKSVNIWFPLKDDGDTNEDDPTWPYD